MKTIRDVCNITKGKENKMIGTMERTGNKRAETYVGIMQINNSAVIFAVRRQDDMTFVKKEMMLSREAVKTLLPLLQEFLGVN